LIPYFFASSVEDLLRAGLDAEAEPFAAGEAHLAQKLVAEHVDARVAAPEKADVPFANASAKGDDALSIGREGVVLDLNHLHGSARDGLLDGVEHVRNRLAPKPPTPARFRAAERAPPRATARGHHDVRVEPVVRRREAVEIFNGVPLGRHEHSLSVAKCGPRNARDGFTLLQPVEKLHERVLALANRNGVDVAVVLEHLARKRRRMRAADHDVRVRAPPLDLPRDERDSPAIRRPARQAVDVSVEVTNDLLNPPPREPREIVNLDLVAGAKRLCADREETVRGLKEVSVEIAFDVLAGRTVARRVGRLAPLGDLPGRRVEKSDAHRRAHRARSPVTAESQPGCARIMIDDFRPIRARGNGAGASRRRQ
jgi:hypothetical protein